MPPRRHRGEPLLPLEQGVFRGTGKTTISLVVWVLGPGHLDVGVVRVSLPRQVGKMPAGGREQTHDVEGHAAADDEHPLTIPVAEEPTKGTISSL